MARTDHTEYGGGEGTPGRFPDGSAKDLTAGEKARVMRSALSSRRGAGIGGALSEADMKRLRANTNGYIDGIGDYSDSVS